MIIVLLVAFGISLIVLGILLILGPIAIWNILITVGIFLLSLSIGLSVLFRD